jgi:hypothetical protein
MTDEGSVELRKGRFGLAGHFLLELFLTNAPSRIQSSTMNPYASGGLRDVGELFATAAVANGSFGFPPNSRGQSAKAPASILTGAGPKSYHSHIDLPTSGFTPILHDPRNQL